MMRVMGCDSGQVSSGWEAVGTGGQLGCSLGGIEASGGFGDGQRGILGWEGLLGG